MASKVSPMRGGKVPKRRIDLTLSIDPHKIDDLIITAVEGGIDYWARKVTVRLFDTQIEIDWRTACDKGFVGKYQLTVVENDVEIEYEHRFHTIDFTKNETAILGLQAMPISHLADFLKGDVDVETADVFIQCCTFGEIRYG